MSPRRHPRWQGGPAVRRLHQAGEGWGVGMWIPTIPQAGVGMWIPTIPRAGVGMWIPIVPRVGVGLWIPTFNVLKNKYVFCCFSHFG